MKDDLASLGLHPGKVIDVAFDRPGTFSRISWQPMSRTSKVPETRQDHLIRISYKAPTLVNMNSS